MIPTLKETEADYKDRQLKTRIELLGGLNDLEEKTPDQAIEFFEELRIKFGKTSKLGWGGGWEKGHSWYLEYSSPETDDEMNARIRAAEEHAVERRKISERTIAKEKALYAKLKKKYGNTPEIK